MGYRNLQDCIKDLERAKQLLRVDEPVDPHLEMAEIQRRVFRAGGPALLFTRPRAASFPCSATSSAPSSGCATSSATRSTPCGGWWTCKSIRPISAAAAAVSATPRTAWHARPRSVARAVLAHADDDRPAAAVESWPDDGGAFITLPQVYTEDPDRPGGHSNLGMYRVQLSGNAVRAGTGEVGLHYQIHRGIGVHHAAALRRGEPLRVNMFVGGPPAMTLAAVMPLPEGMPELAFAGCSAAAACR